MLTKQQKTEWTAALRSGYYRQGKRWLIRDDGSYCCLGVLCKAVLKAPHYFIGSAGGFRFEGELYNSLLPTSLIHGSAQGILANMNDGDDKDFNQIADWIDEHIETSD